MKYGKEEPMNDTIIAMKKDYDNERLKDNPVSITPSGFFGNSAENIIEIENFLTEYEITYLDKFARNIKEWDVTNTHYNEDGTIIYEAEYWKDRVLTSTNLYNQDQKAHMIIEYATKRLKGVIEDRWNISVYSTMPSLVRWLPGQLQMPHADKELHEGENAGKANDFPYYDIGSLFYINDDYKGGQLYFPKQELEFKPKAGSAYFFPGDLHYIHGVKQIESGIRYTCPRFWIIEAHSKPEGS